MQQQQQVIIILFLRCRGVYRSDHHDAVAVSSTIAVTENCYCYCYGQKETETLGATNDVAISLEKYTRATTGNNSNGDYYY